MKRHSRGSDLAAEAEAHPPHVETDTMARTKTRRDPQQPGGGLAPISDADLQSALREHLPGSGPHGVRWRRTFKRRQDWRGSRLFERVKVERPGADDLEVCLKYFAPAPGDGFPAPAALREARAYEFLNGLPSAGTARYFGQVHTPEARHSILVLEWVHGRRLKKIASVERWSAAGSWLGRLHGELSSSGLRHREDLALPRHDSTFFARWAERAARAAVERCPEAGPRLERLLRDYDGVVEALTSTEPTLVHGELYCTNIMLRGGPRGGFCPFDWETAAIGSRTDGSGKPRSGNTSTSWKASWVTWPPRAPGTTASCHEDDQGRVDPMSGEDRGVVAGRGLAPKSWRPPAIDIDESELCDSVAGALAERFGREVEVVSLIRSPSPYATVFPADIVEARLADGTVSRLFVKYLGSEESAHPDKLGPEREIRLYRDVLVGEGLPVVRFFGAPWQPRLGRHQLILEHVDDWNLKYHDLPVWYRAAHEVGRLHAWFADRLPVLRDSGVLSRLAGEYVWDWARRAAAEATDRGSELGARVAGVLRRYDVVAATLDAAPATLVHNDLSPKNVVADSSEKPPRICLVDWESAGIGSGLLDLTNLSYGLGLEARRRMRDAYRSGLEAGGVTASPARELLEQELASEAHKALWRLAHCGAWGLSDREAHQFAEEAETALAALLDPAADAEEG